ncbi:MAG TPA: ChbG/HpnK family deacetylase [Levilinea sp.]|nr:ChbG/HpnK family deacetylase [Levilinea sp.]
MSRKLILNADDYGRTPGVSAGIRHAHLNGIVTSTSALMTRPGIAADLEAARRECPGLEIGVHLVSTSGPSLLPPNDIPSLTGGTPGFRGLVELTEDLANVALEEVFAEWNAQIERFIALTGDSPGHLDSHHHFSYFREDMFEGMASLAVRYSCAVRLQVPLPGHTIGGIPQDLLAAISAYLPRLAARYGLRTPDYYYDGWYDEGATLSGLVNVLAALPEGSATEIMCHPGYADAGLLDAEEGSIYNRQRERELQILTNPDLRAYIAGEDITLIHFRQL